MLTKLCRLTKLDLKLPGDLAAAIALQLPALRFLSVRFWRIAQRDQMVLPSAQTVLSGLSAVTTFREVAFEYSMPVLSPAPPVQHDPRFNWLQLPTTVTVGVQCRSHLKWSAQKPFA